MTATDSIMTASTARDAAPGWVTLLRSVAAAMILTYGFVMVFLARSLVPPLAVGAALFAVALVATLVRPRGAAIAVGVLSVVWLVLDLANAPQVVAGLLRPSTPLQFIPPFAFVLVPLTGTVGLIGLLTRARDDLAGRVAWTACGALLLGIAASVAAGLVSG